MGSNNTTSFESVLKKAGKQNIVFKDDVCDKNLLGTFKRDLSGDQTAVPAGKKVINSFIQDHTEIEKAVETKAKRAYTGSSRTILVSTSQTGNPLLPFLTNTNWTYVKTSATTKIHYDYQVQGRNIIFLSLKYHKLHPEYIGCKLKPLFKTQGNILLCVVDIEDSEDILKELTQMTMFSGFTMLLGFNFEQAAKYLIFLNK